MGANRFEATKGVIQRSLHVALIPMINQMSVVGIVSIPGKQICILFSSVADSAFFYGASDLYSIHSQSIVFQVWISSTTYD